MAEMRSFGRVTVIFGQQNGKYPKEYNIVWLDAVEKNSMLLHLQQLMREGRVGWDGERYLRP